MKVLSIVWGPFGFRADELAEAVGAARVSITVLYGPRYFAPIRYLVLFFRTLVLLNRTRPDVVYAQNPPVFCPLTCLIYCRMAGARLVVDHHSIWRVKTLGRGVVSRVIGLLETFVARASYANTAPHSFWAKQLSDVGANRVLVVHDFVEKNPNQRDEALRRKFTEDPLIAISAHGGHPLERVENEAAAVGAVEGVTLLIAGPPAKLQGRISQMELPKNVRYVGFLDRQEYEKTKASVDMAVNITDEPYTLSHVLLEYAASSLPIVSSRQEVVEDFFGDALLYTDSTSVADIAAKVRAFKDAGLRREYGERVSRRYGSIAAAHLGELRALRALLAP